MTNLNAATALLEKLSAATKAAAWANRNEGDPIWFGGRGAEAVQACKDHGIVFPADFDHGDFVMYVDLACDDGADEWAEEFAAELAALETVAA